MVADTENKRKRGRPKLPDTVLREKVGWYPEMSTRQYQNFMYANRFIAEVLEENHPFFCTGRGIRRQGIAEQLGRMYAEGLQTKEQCKRLAQWVMDDYADGTSVKVLIKTLSLIRKKLKRGVTDQFSTEDEET